MGVGEKRVIAGCDMGSGMYPAFVAAREDHGNRPRIAGVGDKISRASATETSARNVKPSKDGLTALQGDRDEQDWLGFPYRDDYGVKVYHPAEAIKRMNSRARWIYIIANELQIYLASIKWTN